MFAAVFGRSRRSRALQSECRLPKTALITFAPRDARSAAESGDHMEVVVVDGHEVCYGTIGGESFAESPCMHPPIRL